MSALKSIIIQSSLRFVIVSPVPSGFNTVIRSENAGIDLIGLGHKIHGTKGKNHLGGPVAKLVQSMKVRFMEEQRQFGDFNNNRDVNFLMLWIDDYSKTDSNNEQGEYGFIDNSSLKSRFHDFLADSHTQLNGLTIPNVIPPAARETYTTQLTWNISPLLLECMHPDLFL